MNDLANRLSVSIPEAQDLTGYGRKRILAKIESGDYRSFTEGSRRRITTASIREDQNKRLEQHGK